MEIIEALDMPFQLVARAEGILRGTEDFDTTLKRLDAYSECGAHVLYAPGISRMTEVEAMAGHVNKPLNVLAPLIHGATLAQLSATGANRISVGGALHFKNQQTLLKAAQQMISEGSFAWLG